MKNKLSILILFVFGVNLNAAEYTWANAFPIYTYGDVSSIASIYEFIHYIVSHDIVQIVFALGFTFTAIFAGWKARDGDFGEIIKAILAPITLYALFFAPTVNVHITDLRVDKGLINYSTPDGGYRKVDEVPLAIAFVPASTSLLVSLFIDLIDEGWDSISVGNRFSTLGFQEMSRISQQALVLGTFNNLDVNTSSDVYNMRQYVNKCLSIEALKIPSNYQKLAKPSKTFPEMYDPANFDGNIGAINVDFDDASNTPISGKCSDLYVTYVSGVASTLESGFGDVLEGNFPNIDTSSAAFNEAWRENSGVQQAIVGNIRKAMITSAASRALEKDLSTDGIGVDGVAMVTEIAIEKTIANLRTEGLAKYEWTARMLPNAINILLILMLGIFPLMIMVMSFMGFSAAKGVANFFMGYIAMNFNLVSLALVSNIISFYTAQNAQQAIVSYAGMPFGSTQISDFMYQQADMAGLAGLIGAVSVPFVTAALFYGETKGLAAGISAVGGAFRGNVAADAKDTLVDRDAQQEIDKQILNDAKNERDAAAWLTQEGFSKPSNMSAVEAQNQMMKNLQSIGNANAGADIFHSDNAQNFISGSAKQSSQNMNKTAGFGSHEVSMETAGSVAFEDGEVMGSMVNNTRADRDEAGFDAELVGEGQAHQQVAKDMGTQEIGKDSNALEKLTASSRMSAKEQLATGEAMLKEGFNGDGFGAVSDKGNDHLQNVKTQAAEKFNTSAGRGSTVDYDKATDKAFEDGARDGSAVNKASDRMFSGEKDSNGNLLYNRDMAAEGQATNEMAQHAKNMATAKAISEPKTGEQSGYADFINGNSAMARKAANDAIGIGEDWDKLSEKEQIALMAKDKANAASGFRGGIEATNAELMEHGSVDGAIKDMVTGAQEKGKGSATHADNLREKYDDDLKGKNSKGMTLSETMSAIDMSKLDSQEGQAAGVLANKAINSDMYSDNAMYGEMSKQQSTQAKLDAQGGIGGAVGIDVMEASIKAGTQKGSVEQSAKILEDAIKSGAAEGAKTLSDAAAKVAEVQTGSQMGSTAGLMKKFSDPEALKKTLEDSGYKDAAKELEGMSAGDMSAWVASKQAGHMTGMHGLALRNDKGDMTSVGISLGDDGARAMTVDSSFKEDSSRSKTSGSTETFNNDVKKLNNTDPLTTLATNRFGGDMQKAADYARSADGAKWMMDPRNELSVAAAEAGHHIAETTGMSGEGAALVAGGLAGGGLALAIGNKMTKQPIQFKENQLSQLSQITDDDGNVKGYEDSKGHRVADKDGYAVNKSGKRVESGAVKRAWNGLQNKGVDLVSSLTSNSTVHEEANTNSNININCTSNHDKSPNINSNTIIPKSEQQNKPSIAQQIEAQGKFEQTRASMVEHNAKVNALNNGGTSNMLERQKMELNALDGAHNQHMGIDAKPNLQAPSEKGFFSKRMDALSNVWDGSGSWKTKMAMSAGAMALGSTSVMASNMMDAVDPMAHAGGTSLGDSSYGGDELKQMQAKFKSDSNGFTTPSWVQGIQPMSQVPQHVQNAFSTPSGYNTSTAISTSTGLNTNAMGTEIYMANKTDNLYTASTDSQVVRQLEDINMGTEFNQEASEGVRDAVERLMEEDRNKVEE